MPMVHAVDERDYDRVDKNTERLHDRFGTKYVFLCTLRHDWEIKGIDVYLRALPFLSQALNGIFKLLLVNWGSQVDDSKRLISENGVDHLVHWLEPIPRQRLIRLQKSVDVLFDQIALPHFGATAPEGIAAGVPVLMSYEPQSTAWIVSDPAPILTVRTPEDVVRQTLVALDPEWRNAYTDRARNWFMAQHSRKRVVSDHLKMYKRCLQPYK